MRTRERHLFFLQKTIELSNWLDKISFRTAPPTEICCNLVPRVFSLSNMAAAGETLAHSTNHVTDLSTESGNLFKMAAKIKTERIWVRGLETEEKQTKWRQRQTQEKIKIWKNALKSHRNTVEWYSDLIFCSMTFIYFKPERSSVHGT